MKNGKSRRTARLLAAMLMLAVTVIPSGAANMRSFIEAVRRKAAVVYVGTIKEVQFMERTKFDIKARAVVTVSAIARGPEKGAAEALLDYSSYDDKTPMLAGGPQYQLQPGTTVLVFTDSFRSHIPAGTLREHWSERRSRERPPTPPPPSASAAPAGTARRPTHARA